MDIYNVLWEYKTRHYHLTNSLLCISYLISYGHSNWFLLLPLRCHHLLVAPGQSDTSCVWSLLSQNLRQLSDFKYMYRFVQYNRCIHWFYAYYSIYVYIGSSQYACIYTCIHIYTHNIHPQRRMQQLPLFTLETTVFQRLTSLSLLPWLSIIHAVVHQATGRHRFA